MSPRSRCARRSPRRHARREQRVQLDLRPVELGRNLAQPASPSRRLRPGTRDSRIETARARDGRVRGRGRLAPPRPRSRGVTITHPIASGSTRTATSTKRSPSSVRRASRSTSTTVSSVGVEDERDRVELEGLDLALVELCEFGDEWQQPAKRLDVARQNGQLGSEILDPRGQRLDQRHERLQLAADVVRRRRLDGRRRSRPSRRRARAGRRAERAPGAARWPRSARSSSPGNGASSSAGSSRALTSSSSPIRYRRSRTGSTCTFPADDLHLRHGDEHGSRLALVVGRQDERQRGLDRLRRCRPARLPARGPRALLPGARSRPRRPPPRRARRAAARRPRRRRRRGRRRADATPPREPPRGAPPTPHASSRSASSAPSS